MGKAPQFVVVTLPSLVKRCRAKNPEKDTFIPSVCNAQTAAERHAIIHSYAESMASMEKPKTRNGDDVLVSTVLEKLRSLSGDQAIRFDAGIFEDWQIALTMISRHPFCRGKYKIRVYTHNGKVEIGRRVTNKRSLRNTGI